MPEEFVILVDELDIPSGKMEKMEAHRKGILHRAFSVCIINESGDILLQRRALSKYHSAGLWTNTCCSHPRPGEELLHAATRRLREEMGFQCELRPAFSFIYRAELDHNLIEHELDHVFVGTWNASPVPNPEEVAEWKYLSPEELNTEISLHPEQFTAWFRILLPRLLNRSDFSNNT